MLSMYLVYDEDGLAAQGMSHVGEWPGLFSVNEVLPTLDGDPRSGAEWSTGPTRALQPSGPASARPKVAGCQLLLVAVGQLCAVCCIER